MVLCWSWIQINWMWNDESLANTKWTPLLTYVWIGQSYITVVTGRDLSSTPSVQKRYTSSNTFYTISPDMFCTLPTCFRNDLIFCYSLSSLLVVLPLLQSSVYNATIATSRTTVHVISGVQQSIASHGNKLINTEQIIRNNIENSMSKGSLPTSKVLIIYKHIFQ